MTIRRLRSGLVLPRQVLCRDPSPPQAVRPPGCSPIAHVLARAHTRRPRRICDVHEAQPIPLADCQASSPSLYHAPIWQRQLDHPSTSRFIGGRRVPLAILFQNRFALRHPSIVGGEDNLRNDLARRVSRSATSSLSPSPILQAAGTAPPTLLLRKPTKPLPYRPTPAGTARRSCPTAPSGASSPASPVRRTRPSRVETRCPGAGSPSTAP